MSADEMGPVDRMRIEGVAFDTLSGLGEGRRRVRPHPSTNPERERLCVLVCGGRSYNDHQAIESRLSELQAECEANGKRLVVVEGGARGADSIAGRWAQRTEGVEHHRVEASWHGPCAADCPPDHRRRDRDRFSYCPLAGLRRNQKMLDDHPVDLVIAWVGKPLAGSKGTADMVRRARNAGVPVELHEPELAPRLPLGGER
ncbi:MAG TPA: DUF2493 domain-containing protein [Propionibacteriaceae bacterium]|nr:DUF2493 domain-containing protein [Propionibacteriaceae bacterium]